jgi:hypothetical protein
LCGFEVFVQQFVMDISLRVKFKLSVLKSTIEFVSRVVVNFICQNFEVKIYWSYWFCIHQDFRVVDLDRFVWCVLYQSLTSTEKLRLTCEDFEMCDFYWVEWVRVCGFLSRLNYCQVVVRVLTLNIGFPFHQVCRCVFRFGFVFSDGWLNFRIVKFEVLLCVCQFRSHSQIGIVCPRFRLFKFWVPWIRFYYLTLRRCVWRFYVWFVV